MSSAARIRANQQNSLRSTGPVTEAGKQASSANATAHGLTSQRIVLKGEDPAEYDAFRANLIREYNAQTETERVLVEDLAACSWRLARARRVETAVLERIIGEAPDATEALADAFFDQSDDLVRLQRYVTTIERAYYRALDRLTRLQKDRKSQESKQSMQTTWLQSARLGFVSHSSSKSSAAANGKVASPPVSQEPSSAASDASPNFLQVIPGAIERSRPESTPPGPTSTALVTA